MDKNLKIDKLRQKAEKVVQNQIKDLATDNEIVHELRVHQIELEIQNEELREAQIKLEDSRRKYFELYNFAPVGYFTLDEKGIILDVNLAGAGLLGVERRNLNKIALINFIASEHHQIFYQHLKKARETGNKQITEAKYLKKNNDFFYSHMETLPIHDDNNGDFKEFRIAITDITKIKKASNSLQKSEKRYLEFFNNPLMGFALCEIITDNNDQPIDFVYLDVNHAFENFTGLKKEDVLNKKVTSVLPYAEVADIIEIYGNVALTGELANFEYPIPSLNKYYEVAAFSPRKRQFIAFFTDISERKLWESIVKKRGNELSKINTMLNVEIGDHEKAEIKLERIIGKLEASNQELEQFAYVSSHDLREPLRMITSFLQLLEKRYKGRLDEDADEFITFAVEGAKRMDAMINDLLEYSKIGNQERDFNYINCEKILEIVLMNLKTLIEEHEVIITHEALPDIYANDQLMIQLFQNIISNSIKYQSEKRPEIHISVEKKEEEHVFSITDNGIGIDSKHLERIFIIFQRLHTRDEYEGTGIGLAISQKIVHLLGGKIWVESKPGQGSTFYFTIPFKNTMKYPE
jgi:two-component system, chemotaxis family, sensor kinase Cph1